MSNPNAARLGDDIIHTSILADILGELLKRLFALLLGSSWLLLQPLLPPRRQLLQACQLRRLRQRQPPQQPVQPRALSEG